MKTFKLTCSRGYSLFLIFLGLPIIMFVFMAFCILSYKDIPDWAIIILIVLIATYIFQLIYYLLKKNNRIPCLVQIDENGIKIELQKSSFFFSNKLYQSDWEGIRNVSSRYELQKQTRLYSISFSKPSITIYIDTKEKLSNPNLETEFGKLLMEKVAEHNKLPSLTKEKIIDTKNFYQQPWAKVINILVVMILIGLIGIKIFYPEKIDLWQFAYFIIVSFIWLLTYWLNNKK